MKCLLFKQSTASLSSLTGEIKILANFSSISECIIVQIISGFVEVVT